MNFRETDLPVSLKQSKLIIPEGMIARRLSGY